MSVDAGVQWFVGMGFRPAVWTASHRADEVDPVRLVPAPDSDVPFMAKYDALEAVLPSEGYTWGTWLPQPATPVAQVTAAGLTANVPATPYSATPPEWDWGTPDWQGPCCIETGPFEPLPEPSSVPLPASAGLLLVVVAALALLRRLA